jgi:branched-chain amino acid transport system permease protein
VFNIAHFAIALFAGYLGWQLNGVLGLPLVVAAPLVLVLCGPVLGLVLERVVFRPLEARRATSSEKLVASLGVAVVLLAAINVFWGPGVQGTADEPVPRLFPLETFSWGSITLDTERVLTVVTVLVTGGALYVLLRRTFLGVQIRAVVDRRELAELAAIDANRVSQVAWSLGCGLAALTGLLLAPPALEPIRIILFGIETFSVAVVARLTSIPIAMVFGFLVMGLGRSLLDLYQPFGVDGDWAETYQAVVTNLSSIVLFVALVVFRRLDEAGDSGSTAHGFVSSAFGAARRATTSGRVSGVIGAVVLTSVPLVLTGADLRQAHRFIALAVVFVSIVCITGFSGHLTLGQASIAGAGGFFTARAANAWDLPVLAAMVVGAGAALVLGLIAGYPALRRKGLFLGLTTLALALLVDRFVFNNPDIDLFSGGPGGLTVRRPTFLWLDLDGDVAFYLYELIVLALVLFLARNMRTGRLGRVLAAMRDSETAARSIGIGMRRAKLFVFGVSSAIAGIGGALLTQADQNFDPTTFNPVIGLFWFTAVIVCGVSSARGALLAAALYVAIPHVTGQDVQSAIGLFGLAALALGRLPGGLIAQLARLGAALGHRTTEEYVRARAARRAAAPPEPVPSAFARTVLAERQAR